MQADIVQLHDQPHRAIDQRRDADAHQRQDDRAPPAAGRDLGQRDGHDLRREDEIGAHRALHAGLFERGGIGDGAALSAWWPPCSFSSSFSAPSKLRNSPPAISSGASPRQNGRKQQRQRQQDHQLVDRLPCAMRAITGSSRSGVKR
jgi:hypothetical protein